MSFDVFLQRFADGKPAEVDRRLVLDVLRTTAFRGPDAFGFYVVAVWFPKLRIARRAEPPRERFAEPGLGSVSHPGNVSIGPHEDGVRRGHFAQHRQLPSSGVPGLD